MFENNDMPVDVSEDAQKRGIAYPVKLTESLYRALTPNEFLVQFGISYEERLNNILGVLKGSIVPNEGGVKETIPEEGASIPYAITQGPFIREIPVVIRAERKTDGGGQEILLSIAQDEE